MFWNGKDVQYGFQASPLVVRVHSIAVHLVGKWSMPNPSFKWNRFLSYYFPIVIYFPFYS